MLSYSCFANHVEYLTEKHFFILDVPCSSDSTSDQDGYGPSTSLDSNMDGRRMWQRSGNLIFNINFWAIVILKYIFELEK